MATLNVDSRAYNGGVGGDTLIDVEQGDTIIISATGFWFAGDPGGAPGYGPDGGPTYDGSVIAPTINQGSLLGRIGTSGAWFKVGSTYEGIAALSGRLYLAINDAACCFADNSGSLSADIEVKLLQRGPTDCECGIYAAADADEDGNG